MLREDFILTLAASDRAIAQVLLPPLDLTLLQWQTLWQSVLVGNPATTISPSQIGVANGVAGLNASGVVPANQLPSTPVFTTLQLGTGGPLFRNNAGTIEARNAANSAAAPLSVSTLTVNGGLYVRQQAVPSNPVTGQRWDEVDASGLHVNSWYYDGTDWIEAIVRHQGFPERTFSSSSSFAELFFPAGRLLIRRVSYGLNTTATYNSTDYWEILLRTRIPGVTDYTSTRQIINTAVDSNTQYIVTANQKTVAGDTQVHMVANRFGTAAAINIRASFQYSFIR